MELVGVSKNGEAKGLSPKEVALAEGDTAHSRIESGKPDPAFSSVQDRQAMTGTYRSLHADQYLQT